MQHEQRRSSRSMLRALHATWHHCTSVPGHTGMQEHRVWQRMHAVCQNTPPKSCMGSSRVCPELTERCAGPSGDEAPCSPSGRAHESNATHQCRVVGANACVPSLRRYLVYFVHRHLEYRRAEVEAQAAATGISNLPGGTGAEESFNAHWWTGPTVSHFFVVLALTHGLPAHISVLKLTRCCMIAPAQASLTTWSGVGHMEAHSTRHSGTSICPVTRLLKG